MKAAKIKESLINKFWDAIYPMLMSARDFLIKINLINHDFRQPFVLGHLNPTKTHEQLVEHLEKQGFTNHFFAWNDPGQKYSLRLRKDFVYQYHLRIFEDNEIRGHFELTPEAHPIKHIKDCGMEQQQEEFMRYLKDWVIKKS